MSQEETKIDVPASQPDADLACDFTIARSEVGLRERLAPLVAAPPRRLSDGIELTLRGEAWGDVRRYVEVESQCCPFLNLKVRRTSDAVVLTVTGRPDAQDLILEMFSGPGRDSCC